MKNKNLTLFFSKFIDFFSHRIRVNAHNNQLLFFTTTKPFSQDYPNNHKSTKTPKPSTTKTKTTKTNQPNKKSHSLSIKLGFTPFSKLFSKTLFFTNLSQPTIFF